MVKIGDKVRRNLTGFLNTKESPSQKCVGQVVWIHPRRRFYVAEFRFGNEIIRECYTEGM